MVSREAAIEAIENERLFQAIDKRSMIKIDFHVGEKIPGELSRSAAGGDRTSGQQGGCNLGQALMDPERKPSVSTRRDGDVET